MREDFILNNFYDSLRKATKKQLDIAARGVFFSLSLEEAATVIEIIVSNDHAVDNAHIRSLLIGYRF